MLPTVYIGGIYPVYRTLSKLSSTLLSPVQIKIFRLNKISLMQQNPNRMLALLEAGFLQLGGVKSIGTSVAMHSPSQN